MLILFVCFGTAAFVGSVTWAMSIWWWGIDAGAPQAGAETVATTVRRHVVAARWVRAHLRPDAATAALLGVVAVVAIIGGGLFGLLLEMARSHTGFGALDTSATRFGAAHATPMSTHVLRVVTQLGGAVVLVPLAVVVGVLEARRRRAWATIAFLSVVVAGQYLLANVIKALVDRLRPDVLRLTGFSGPSFPSGHATASAAVFSAFALLVGRGRSVPAKSGVAGVSVGSAVLIATTRVMLGVHWLTDVLAGLCLGWTWFAVTSIAFGGRRLRFGAPIKTAEAVLESMTPADCRHARASRAG